MPSWERQIGRATCSRSSNPGHTSQRLRQRSSLPREWVSPRSFERGFASSGARLRGIKRPMPSSTAAGSKPPTLSTRSARVRSPHLQRSGPPRHFSPRDDAPKRIKISHEPWSSGARSARSGTSAKVKLCLPRVRDRARHRSNPEACYLRARLVEDDRHHQRTGAFLMPSNAAFDRTSSVARPAGRPLVILTLAVAFALLFGIGVAAGATPPAAQPDLGPNVVIFDPSMPTSQIQARVDAIAAEQVPNQFGSQRYALLFKPGTYGTAAHPLNFQVGYYTSVAGLGLSPGDVAVNGSIYVRNQCDAGGCVALNNFWRSLSNLTINVNTPGFGCYNGEFWAVSQAAPMRRVHVNGFATLMDYCTGPSFASGGFIADSAFDGSVIVNGSQQQWLTRNSKVDVWTNAVWNQVFLGVIGAPAQSFPNPPYTTLATSPVTREAPYLYEDASGGFAVFVPSVQHDTAGTSWATGQTPGVSIPLDRFFIARPGDSAPSITSALATGKNLILTPGVYHLDQTIEVPHPDTVVLGLGFPTLDPDNGRPAMRLVNAGGDVVSGLIFDAGARNSPVLLQVGTGHDRGDPSDPSALSDVFFLVGGSAVGSATARLVVDSVNVICDDIWAWRADEASGVGGT